VGRPVRVASANLLFPLGFRLTGIDVAILPGESAEAAISIREMSLRMPIVSSVQGYLGPDLDLIGPRMAAMRTMDGKLVFPVELAPESATQQQNPKLPFRRLRIREGKFLFIDQGIRPEATWLLKDLSVDISPGPRLGGYTLSASSLLEMGANEAVGRLELRGEILPLAPLPTYELTITVSHERLWLLAPYIRPILGTSPSKGSCTIETTLSLQEGKIIAQNKLLARDVSFATEEPTLLGPPGNKLVSLLADKDGNVRLSFVVTGKPGEKLNWSDLTAAALREAMRQALSREIQKVLTDTELAPVEEIIRKGLESIGR